ncbi:MAG: CmcI family methyltransferase [Candidatus Aminicenantales bacterium]
MSVRSAIKNKSRVAVESAILAALLAILMLIVAGVIRPGKESASLSDQDIINRFNQIYYNSKVWQRTEYLGISVQQNPCDLWIFQEIISELKPDLIIETGTFNGGSTLFFADTLGRIGEQGRVITVDLNPQIDKAMTYESFRNHVEVITGDSASPEVVAMIEQKAGNSKVLVTLDSLHTKDHVLKELKAYSKFVSLGSYLIVQDTNINGHPSYPTFGPGPMEAVEEFLKNNKDFVVDRSREKLLLTSYPSGFLKRIR